MYFENKYLCKKLQYITLFAKKQVGDGAVGANCVRPQILPTYGDGTRGGASPTNDVSCGRWTGDRGRSPLRNDALYPCRGRCPHRPAETRWDGKTHRARNARPYMGIMHRHTRANTVRPYNIHVYPHISRRGRCPHRPAKYSKTKRDAVDCVPYETAPQIIVKPIGRAMRAPTDAVFWYRFPCFVLS